MTKSLEVLAAQAFAKVFVLTLAASGALTSKTVALAVGHVVTATGGVTAAFTKIPKATALKPFAKSGQAALGTPVMV